MYSSGRTRSHCFCCESLDIRREWGVMSPFFAQRALLRGPQAVPMIRCNACGTRYFDFTPTEEELSRLYEDYRGEAYFQLRNRFEPSYTRAFNDSLGGDAGMQERRAVLHKALFECGIDSELGAVLDHGGDRGQMLLGLKAPLRAVYDISGVAAEPGVQAIPEAELRVHDWNLILCCHVLEHLPDPEAYLSKLLSLGQVGTYYFFEVPNENFRSIAISGWWIWKYWIDFAIKWPWLFKKLEMLSGKFNGRLHFIPPFLFYPLCEHLSFFTVTGITTLLQRYGLKILSSGVRETGHIVVVAQKI